MSALTLRQRLSAIETGALSASASIAEFAERVDAADGDIRAFVRRAPAETLEAARHAAGPLAGIPLGIKDIYDTADMATEHGSPIYAGHRPRADATLVAIAREKGAFIAGKTATTEFAYLTPAKTRNPRDLAHTPGGSSSGSAAAVASGMVAGAFGSQTAGSIIRPAAFCGVAGYKPSFRLLPTVGMKSFAWSLDTAGLFAPTVSDVALLAALLTGRALDVEPVEARDLRIGIYRSGADDALSPEMAEAVSRAGRLMERAGASLIDVAETETLAAARLAQPLIQSYEGAQSLAHERLIEGARLSESLRQALAEGAALSPERYDEARRAARQGRKAATALFEEVDALIAPSALGAAPASLATTGDPAMNRLWTVTGNPCVNVPGFQDEDGLPLGITLVTRFGRDRAALSIADLLERLQRPD
ncbi:MULTISPECIES: amidase [unclassified Aureimonas]|uniref:amidase n=1 Tax=unclassified Aureimonas TaxID=2615206 RepID=UPI0006F6B541|nr:MULTISPECIES: amidase [unclassified Aureimonas]KQT52815.1 amidase [Aureimonas sp. Leaf427]KQT80275.1 amidase [Aureimonas sp. Leaf460]